jgi:predicted RNase H-like HicB family nuclease
MREKTRKNHHLICSRIPKLGAVIQLLDIIFVLFIIFNVRHIIQFKVYKGEKYYIGESVDLPIVTQGKTIDEVVSNIQEALALHLEGEDLQELDLASRPAVMVNFELEPLYA